MREGGLSLLIAFNIASGSEANINTSCEMEIFNFLWLIWDDVVTLASEPDAMLKDYL